MEQKTNPDAQSLNAGATSTKSPEDMMQFLIEQGMEDEALAIQKKHGDRLKGNVYTEQMLRKFITQDSKMLKVKDNVRKLAPIDDTILIRGDTGTGKELIARALHGRRDGNFIAINCAGMPEGLIESELFGHKRGAFTGAQNDNKGLIKAADNGTLFLDEIGELPIQMQAKLLRVMQERTVRRVGADSEESISCRFVCATHCNLKRMVENGKFRLDLYARISTFELLTTALSERLADIPLIIDDIDADVNMPRSINWDEIDLTLNVRSIQRYVRRYKVLGQIPGSDFTFLD